MIDATDVHCIFNVYIIYFLLKCWFIIKLSWLLCTRPTSKRSDRPFHWLTDRPTDEHHSYIILINLNSTFSIRPIAVESGIKRSANCLSFKSEILKNLEVHFIHIIYFRTIFLISAWKPRFCFESVEVHLEQNKQCPCRAQQYRFPSKGKELFWFPHSRCFARFHVIRIGVGSNSNLNEFLLL